MSPDEHDEYFVVNFSDMVIVYAGTAQDCQQFIDESYDSLAILDAEDVLRYGEDLRDCIV